MTTLYFLSALAGAASIVAVFALDGSFAFSAFALEGALAFAGALTASTLASSSKLWMIFSSDDSAGRTGFPSCCQVDGCTISIGMKLAV